MYANPLNVPAVSVATAKAALIEQFRDPVLRHRATMLWGTRGVGKSSIVRQVAEHFALPLVDLRLTTIEPVDIRGAIYADDASGRTVWFPPEFLPGPDQPEGILFLDEITAADQRLQSSAYSLILDRRVGAYALPDGWQVIAAGNATFHGAVSQDMGTALADRMFHFHVQSTLEAFIAYALEHRLAPEVMAYLRVRADRLDDTQSQLANDHLVGASPRGWEDVSAVLESSMPEETRRLFVQGRIGAANAAEFFGVLRELRAGADVAKLLAAAPGQETAALLPGSLDGLYGLVYGLVAAVSDASTLARAFAIVEQYPDLRAASPLPILEAQTLTMELLLGRALALGLEEVAQEDPAYARYLARREADLDVRAAR
ncbi:MAG: MoxR family ATPase [Pseudomonadales bacterium]|jgi:MoxR-like ATPase|nr:MoxR family ATPase [Pseudomonadales bacterium]